MAYTIHEIHALSPTTTRLIVRDTATGTYHISTVHVPIAHVRNCTQAFNINIPKCITIPPVILSQIFPAYNSTSMTRCDITRFGTPYQLERNAVPGYWIKKQPLLPNDVYRSEAYRIGELVKSEVRFCEAVKRKYESTGLRAENHLATYNGVNVDAVLGRVTSIVFERYMTDLGNFVRQGHLRTKEQARTVMEGVKKALQQVHELGFVHCDVSASNVFLNYTHAKPDSISTSSPSSPSLSLSSLSSSSPAPSPPPTTNWNNDENGKMNGRTNELTIIHVVLGDFDAVLKVGERVLHKRAVGKGWPKNVKWGDRVTEEVDWHGYKVLEHWVYKQVGVDVMDEEERNGDGDEGWTTVRAGKW